VECIKTSVQRDRVSSRVKVRVMVFKRHFQQHYVVYSMQHYVIKIVSDLRQWFSLGIPVSSTIKIVSLNTTQTIQHYVIKFVSYF
jgi:hypothetical protein